MKFSLFLALFVLGSARAVDQAAQSKEEARMLRNPQELEVDIHGHRELWGSGFSWNNLLCTCLTVPCSVMHQRVF
jgi:hypothetical protein